MSLMEIARSLLPKVDSTEDGKPYDFMIKRTIQEGNFEEEAISGKILGLPKYQ